MTQRSLVLSMAAGLLVTAPVAATAAGHTQRVVAARGDGFASAHLGERARPAERALAATLGAPRHRFHKATVGCDISRTTTWPHFTAFYDKGKLVGYEYRGVTGDVVARGPRGLHVGERLRTAERREGARFHRSTAQGGSWRLRTARGRLIGYLSSEQRSARILTIDAGDVGCPAMTP